MPTFAYKGRNRLNELVQGEREAANQEELRALLRREQVVMTQAAEKGRDSVTAARSKIGRSSVRYEVGIFRAGQHTAAQRQRDQRRLVRRQVDLQPAADHEHVVAGENERGRNAARVRRRVASESPELVDPAEVRDMLFDRCEPSVHPGHGEPHVFDRAPGLGGDFFELGVRDPARACADRLQGGDGGAEVASDIFANALECEGGLAWRTDGKNPLSRVPAVLRSCKLR